MIRACLWLAALGLPVPAVAQAQQEIGVKDGEAVPNLRPCIDFIARGNTRATGEYQHVAIEDDMLGHGYHFARFRRADNIVGRGRRTFRFRVFSHATPRLLTQRDGVIFTRANGREQSFVDWAWVWTDSRGRDFIPIMAWPDPEHRASGWEPAAIRSFVKPVAYQMPQPFWDRDGLDPEEFDEPDLFVRHGKQAHVRFGLYLSDLPALMAAAKGESCWR